MWTPETGFSEAKRRIAEERRLRTGSLNLSGLRLQALPSEIKLLSNLTKINLSNNFVGDKGAEHLSEIKSLTSINLMSNGIGHEGAAHLSRLASLTSLDLGSNKVGDAGAEQLSKLTSLAKLDLDSNKISDAGAKHLSGLTSLTVLFLNRNEIGEAGAEQLSKLTSLTALFLNRNEIGDAGAEQLSKLTSLTQLSLGSIGVGDEGAQHLSKLTSLTVLILYGNEIGDAGAKHLSNLTSLTEFELRNNNITAAGAEHLSQLTSLTKLDLGHNLIGADGASHLSILSALVKLNLHSSKIGDKGAQHLSKLTGLRQLNLSFNELGAQSAYHLSKLTGLTTFILPYNEIGDEGAQQLSKLVALKTLNLGANEVGDEGVKRFSDLTNLEDLWMHQNSIGSAGFSEIAKCKSLLDLHLSDNSISDISSLSNFRQIKSISVVNNPIDRFIRADFIGHASLSKFFADTLGDVPNEILSADSVDDCLDRLLVYFAALERGQPQELSDVKIMILGNGQIGKTQMRRFICEEDYDENIISTHGVDVCETNLCLHGDEEIDLKIWDFGGQDIYLGTHSLFLKSRAVFPLVWTPRSENNETHIVDAYESKNFPISYWVDYVKKLAGLRAPILIVQSQCDLPEQAQAAPIDRSLLEEFTFRPREIGFSAKEGTGGDALRGGIKEAVDFLNRQRGAVKIGEGWANIKKEIERRQREDRMIEQSELRTNRLMSRKEFDRLARDIGGIEGETEADILLGYLHDIGTVFYQAGHFDEQIILDQQWALDAIYAIFHRENGLYKAIQDDRGRFTRTRLDRWIWKDSYTKTEQASLISMMRSCDICFTIKKESEVHGEAIYVAPDLLPIREDLFDERTAAWEDQATSYYAHYQFDLLPPALLRNLMARVGEKVGQHAVYWRNGFYFADGNTGAKARVEAKLDDPKKWSGELKIQTKDGQSDSLLSQLLEMVESFCSRSGIEPLTVEKGDSDARKQDRAKLIDLAPAGQLDQTSELEQQTKSSIRIRPQLNVSDKEECFISYAWGELSDPFCERILAFEKVCNKIEALGMEPFFDKEKMSNSEAISTFMDRATNKPKSVIIISEKYLRSPFCMFEMTSLYRKARSDVQRLRECTRVIVLGDANVSKAEDWLYWQDYWDAEVERYDGMMRDRVARKIPTKILADSKYVSDFASVVGDLLAAISDTIHYRGVDSVEDLKF